MLLECLLIVICFTVLCINGPLGRSPLPQSPCPNIFQYGYDGGGVLYGTLQVISRSERAIQLNVQLSVGNHVEGYNGNIELANSKVEVIKEVMNRRPVHYNLYFPLWTGVPPKVTKISVNGEMICSGPKIDIGIVPVLTTINLQHTLKINITPGVASVSTINNHESVPRLENNYYKPTEANFYPTLTKNDVVQIRNINFSPKLPKDLSKVYPKNPFFLNLTSKDSSEVENLFLPARSKIENQQIFHFPIESEIEETPFVDLNLIRTPFSEICGRTTTTNQLVVNGSPVPKGAYPWLAAIFGIKTLGPEFRCTGSLISKKHVVTAAHCLEDSKKRLQPEEVLLVLGKLNIKKWTRDEGDFITEAATLHIHPDYQAMTSDADIAIIVLSETIEFTKYIRPVCIWTEKNDLNLVVGEVGTVVGWGKSETGVLVTAEAKQTVLPIVNQQECIRSMYTFQFITSDRTFCAGFRNGSGPCNGDSGGGFLLKRNGRWTLRGVVSMSLSDQVRRTCDLDNYVVFNDASKFTNWLLSFIK